MVLVADECIHSRFKDRLPGLVYKLDLEKAFDMVDWDFLLCPMRKMGFGLKWRDWIKECVSTTTYSILINGSPKGFFPVERGLHQGDPLSPFRFAIVGEAVCRMLSKVEDCNLICGFKPSSMLL